MSSQNDSCVSSSCLIIGSGPAAYTAAIYLGRAERQPILAGGDVHGGQLTTTTDVENFPGFVSIQGQALMDQMHAQAQTYGAKFYPDFITKLDLSSRPFQAWSAERTFIAKTIILATGAKAKWLGLDSEKEFLGYGVSSCATCDGHFFRNKKVIVVGGGNSAVEEALYLSHIVDHVTLVHRRDSLRAEEILQKRLRQKENVSFMWSHTVLEILGQKQPRRKITGVRLKNEKTQEEVMIQADGVFVAIGHTPNTALLRDYKDLLDDEGYARTQPDRSSTSIDGLFIAGDVKDKIYRQAITAAGQGCMAAMDAEKYLQACTI